MRTLSKILLIISMVLCGITAISVYCAPALEELSLTTSQLQVIINSSEKLEVITTPDKITVSVHEIEWVSSNEDIATVDDGEVTGIGVGETVITAKYGDFELKCEVEVLPINVQSISLDCDYSAIHIDETMQMNASISPIDATYKELKWESSNPLVATISENGIVTGVSEGQTTITATAHNGVKATNTIDVKETIEIESISLTINTSTPHALKYGGGYKLTCDYYPANADNKIISWSSTNSEVLSVDENGNIVVHKDGSATIEATTANGKNASINLNVPRVEAKTIYIADKSGSNILQTVELKVGETMQLYVKFFSYGGDKPTTREIEWTSSNDDIVSVDENGLITGIAASDILPERIRATAKGVSGVSDVVEILVVA
ncbi:MAG: Ig-like domain-containing protein [Clostridia bacterium]|nr:Ig-like domain-containing protein [Clostridia bacterium]